MRQMFGLILALIMAISVNAQKNIDIDSHRFKFTYRGFPVQPQNPKFFYYSKQTIIPEDIRSSVSSVDDLYGALEIEGQRSVSDAKDADFSVLLDMSSVSFSTPEAKERVEEITDKDGKITGRNYYYSIVFRYSFSAKVELKQGDKIICNRLASNVVSSEYQTKEYSSMSDANNNWKLQRDDVYNKIRNDLAFGAARNATAVLSSQYGFAKSTSSEIIKTMDEKKHPENEILREMADRLKTKLESMNADNGLTEADVEEELNYFKELPNRFTDPKLKADIKLRYIGYYNVAKIYFYLDQPEKVAEYADLLFANGHDKGDGKKMKEDTVKLMESFNAIGIKVRHFDTAPYFTD